MKSYQVRQAAQKSSLLCLPTILLFPGGLWRTPLNLRSKGIRKKEKKKATSMFLWP